MKGKRLMIRMWRIARGEPYGLHMWFDPSCEYVRLYRLPLSDSSVAPQDGLRGSVDSQGEIGYLDRVVSVSVSGDDDDSETYIQEQFNFNSESEDDLPF